MDPEGYWFKSSKFEIEPGEDQDINPGIYGRQLAVWLKSRLEESGYRVEDIINEDWGRCLVCQRDSFFLWVGCANVSDFDATQPAADLPSKEAITWHCFATAEVPFWKRLFRKIDTGPATSKLNAVLGKILGAEREITLMEQPQSK
jgi:hypothetical protein